ncbi:hypothetical protein M2G36_21795 [Vibrio vulnificus]|nr:hypothetical protein [Vibrio vulnificus]
MSFGGESGCGNLVYAAFTP